MIRILIADDNELIRRGLRTLLSARPNWEICGEAKDGKEAVEQAAKLSPDVVLMDISMPHFNGLEAARLIRKAVPKARILLLSQHESSSLLESVLEFGAQGYVCKSDLARDLPAAIDGLWQEGEILEGNFNQS